MEERDIWLVWEIHPVMVNPDHVYHEYSLRAVAESEALARTYSKIIRKEAKDFDRPRPNIDIEKRETNHLYGYAMNERLIRLPKDAKEEK